MILKVENASFSYDATPILRDISFELEDEKVLTILGPNGAGKTTLLKCIMGFLKWTGGETLLSGRPVKEYSEKEMWQKISYVPQAKYSVFSYRVLDMVVMGLNSRQSFFATPKEEDYDKAAAMLESLEAKKLAMRYCNELSGGELQMVMIARALISSPELLVLDEPESNLDMRNQLRVLGAIEKASRELNTACLINTHFPNHALKISDKTLMMGYGGTRYSGDTKEIVTEENIERFFGVHSKIVEFKADKQDYRTIFPIGIASGE